MDNVVRIKDPLDAGSCLAWSIKRMAEMRKSIKSAAIVVLMSAPLYAIGYQNGQFPVLGWLMALMLGSVALGLVVTHISGESLGKGGWRRAARAVSPAGLAFSVFGGLSIAGSLAVVSAIGGSWVPSGWLAFYDNSLVWWWKPIAHLSAMGVMFLAVAPFVVLSVVVQAGGRLSNDNARHWVRSYLHGTAYNPWRVMIWCYPVALFAFVPVAGIVALPIAGWMVIRFYRYAYATKKT